MNKAVLGKTIKIAFAAVAAILFAELLRLRGTEEWLLPALCSLLSYVFIFWDSILLLSHYIYFYLR